MSELKRLRQECPEKMQVVLDEETSKRQQLRMAESLPEKKFRPEIEGLRAVGALLVASYHIWFGRVSGGVDVFFVVASFLLTGTLARAAVSPVGIKFFSFWGRLLTRLLPLSFTVLVFAYIISIVWLPQSRWPSSYQEILASALYFENWRLAWDAVDYAAQSNALSPVQHFWAMSLQGQMYLIWPFLIALGVFIAVKAKMKVKTILIGVFSVVFVLSFIHSVITTEQNQAFAYFDTGARLWEFALGSLLYLLVDKLKFPQHIRVVLGWLGFLGVVSCGIVLQVSTMFPGYAALWPTLSVALVVIAGATGSKYGIDRFLAAKPMVFFGSLSYGIYLWHWPLLVLYRYYSGSLQAPFLMGLLIIISAILLSALTTKYIEKPLRSGKFVEKKWFKPVFLLTYLLVMALLLGGWKLYMVRAEDRPVDVVEQGAQVLTNDEEGWQGTKGPLSPAMWTMDEQWYDWDDFPGTCQGGTKAEYLFCETSSDDPETPVMMIAGHSHMEMWMPTFLELAERENLRLKVYIKSGCPLSDTLEDPVPDQSCLDFNNMVLDKALTERPQVVTLFGNYSNQYLQQPDFIPAGTFSLINKINEAGVNTFVLRDTGKFEKSRPECVERYGAYSAQCTVPETEIRNLSLDMGVYSNMEHAVVYDPIEWVCPEGMCPSVIGNIVVYLDESHITQTYMRTLVSLVAPEMEKALEAKPQMLSADSEEHNSEEQHGGEQSQQGSSEEIKEEGADQSPEADSPEESASPEAAHQSGEAPAGEE